MQTNIFSEFDDVKLGDARLDGRLLKILERVQVNPSLSFPDMFKSLAELEGFYRFIENPYFSDKELLKPHFMATQERANEAESVLMLHDTTEFQFSGDRSGLPRTTGKLRAAFFGHFSLAVNEIGNVPLGIMGMSTWARNGKTRSALRREGVARKKLLAIPSENDRWFEGMEQTASFFDRPDFLIHVCDSAADDYNIFGNCIKRDFHFVIRACQNRKLVGSAEKLREVLQSQPVAAQRTVALSRRQSSCTTKRRILKRSERTVLLEIRSGQIQLKRSCLNAQELPPSLNLNAVIVSERQAPDDCEPVDWILLTTQPISTTAEILRIVDIYRARWQIEEYFKSLKTGCSYEKRQLGSYETLRKCLALFAPLAWSILLLRSQARLNTSASASTVLPGPFLEVLRLETGKTLHTAQEALLAVARLGGHIKYNGPPGWLVLWRGMHELALMAKGFYLSNKYYSPVKKKM